ncbi:MAG: phosphoribosylanthranilate isomerase [Phycisphaerales bacterium]|nr:phosphoribosylanthranilate isomerase [Phycisphaerales bacterium]
MPRTRLKVCCISSRAEAQLAIAHGADALGLVGTMPSGPGPIPDDLIADIARAVPPPIATFLLTSEVDPDAVVAHVRRAHVNTVQLVDDETQPDVYRALRTELPAIRIVQVIHVIDDTSIDRALTAAPHVDALLLDSGNPGAQIRELGGTGRTHNWDVSRTIVERSPVPVFLAGGLRADNIASAVAAVRPYGVDLCSGVRTNGALDAAKLDRFVTRLRATAG